MEAKNTMIGKLAQRNSDLVDALDSIQTSVYESEIKTGDKDEILNIIETALSLQPPLAEAEDGK